MTEKAPEIRITVGGKLAYTTAQAATKHDRPVPQMRTLISRLGVEPVAHLDTRTPLYGATALAKAIRGMKGRGAPGVPRPRG
jgi:hypothetical protein